MHALGKVREASYRMVVVVVVVVEYRSPNCIDGLDQLG
jgi:hypothetical protein